MANPTSPYSTLGSIRAAVINDAKEQSSTALVAQVNRWIQEGYENVFRSKKRDWADDTYTYQLSSAVQSVCNVTNGSPFVTFSSGTPTLPTTSGQTFKFYTTGFQEIYTVLSVSGLTVTLNNKYLGPTNTATSGIYALESLNLDPQIRTVYQTYHNYNSAPVTEVGPQTMREIKTLNGPQLDYATYSSIFGQDSTGASRKLVLYPAPNKAYTINVDVNKFADTLTLDTDAPTMPIQYRQVLYFYAMYKLWSYHRNDAKASESLALYKARCDEIDAETRAEIDFPKISVKYPRGGTMRTFTQPFDIRYRN